MLHFLLFLQLGIEYCFMKKLKSLKQESNVHVGLYETVLYKLRDIGPILKKFKHKMAQKASRVIQGRQ